MRLIAFWIAIALTASTAAAAQPFEGRWYGTLTMGDGRVIESIIDADVANDGHWVVALTQVSLGRVHQPILEYNIVAEAVDLEVLIGTDTQTWRGTLGQDNGVYEGEVAGPGDASGRFHLARRPPIESLDGSMTFSGSVISPGRDFEHLQVDLVKRDGRWMADVDFPSCGLGNYPADVTAQGNGLQVVVAMDPPIRIAFVPTVPLDDPAAPREVMGTWHNGGQTSLFLLRRHDGGPLAEPRYPQTPHLPLPYGQRHLIIEHPIGHRLGITLTLPRSQTPTPGVVLVSSQGGGDRDNMIYGHRFQAVWADALARQEIASVRFDDRGVGHSTLPEGQQMDAIGLNDSIMDVRHLVEWLGQQPSIDPKQCGIISFGDAGLVGMSVAASMSQEVQFLVLLSTSGVPADQVMRLAKKRFFEGLPVDRELAHKALVAWGILLDVARDPMATPVEVREVATRFLQAQQRLSGGAERPIDETRVDLLMREVGLPKARVALRIDPAMILPRLRCPVLALSGGADVAVPVSLSLPHIEAAMQRTGGEIDTIEIAGLNHRLQPVDPADPVDPSRIRATADPRALRAVTDWIHAVADPVVEPNGLQDAAP